jgi:hypothetical protein
MRRLLVCLFVMLFLKTILLSQTLEILHLPGYLQGLNGTNNQRIPFVYRARISGLKAGAVYRYYNQCVSSGDSPNSAGAGNCIYAAETGFLRTTSASLSVAGGYGTFSADSSGTYEGWFINESTGNVRFTPGKSVFLRITINDGGGGSSAAARLTSVDSVRVLLFDSTRNDNSGTGVRGTSSARPGDFVLMYDNVEGLGRPVSGTFVESDGTDNTTANSYVSFYGKSVNGINGAFGLIIPNTLSLGVRRIETRALGSGALVGLATDEDGGWPGGAQTMSPARGVSELVLTDRDSPAPVRLGSFTATLMLQGIVRLAWRTLNEVNNAGFALQRRSSASAAWEEFGLGLIPGHGTSVIPLEYVCWDSSASPGANQYRLRQMDLSGSSRILDSVDAIVASVPSQLPRASCALENCFPNPCNPTTTIRFYIAGSSHVTLQVFDLLGKEVARLLDVWQPAGEGSVIFDASGLAGGVYFCRLRAGGIQRTTKIWVVR